jgi:dTMP kinase
MRGRLVVFEGIDGAGTETQSKMLLSHLKSKKIPAERICYPDYDNAIGKLLKSFLDRKSELSPEMQFLLYAGDMVKDKEKINTWLGQGEIVVSDRYFNSTVVYQGLRGFGLKKALKFAEDFGIPRPDVVIFLKISPEESMKRKMKENRRLDRHEEDGLFLGQVNESYGRMAIESVFGRWFIIDGEKPKQEVFREVLNVLETSRII